MLILLTITAVLILLFFILHHVAMAKLKNTPIEADHDKAIILNEKNFDHHLKDRTMLVDFWASWCMPCRVMAPVINEVAQELEGNSGIGKVDVEVNRLLADKYKVRNIPTLIIFKNGEEINRFTGIKSKDFLLKEIARS